MQQREETKASLSSYVGRLNIKDNSFPVQGLLKKLGIKLPYGPAVPLLGTYLEKTIIQKDTCTPVFTETLFTIVRTWKQPRCLLTDEWMKVVVHMYNGILLRHKKE